MSVIDPKQTLRPPPAPASARKGALIHGILLTGRVGTIYSSEAKLDRDRVAALGHAKLHFAGLRRRHVLIYLGAAAIIALTSADAFSSPGHKLVASHQNKAVKAGTGKHRVAISASRRHKVVKADSPKQVAAVSRRNKKALSLFSDLAETSNDAATLEALGELAARHNDAQAMLVLGKTGLARGLAMERYAFPQIGVPAYSPIAPRIDRCMVYSIVRTESAFDQRDTSPANAVGLMQVTPEAARDTAKRFGVDYDWKRLASDPVYNTLGGQARRPPQSQN